VSFSGTQRIESSLRVLQSRSATTVCPDQVLGGVAKVGEMQRFDIQGDGMNDEPREAIICDECGRALNGIAELVDHYKLKHRKKKTA